MIHLDKKAQVRLKSDGTLYEFLGMQTNKSEAIRMGLRLLIEQHGMTDLTNPDSDDKIEMPKAAKPRKKKPRPAKHEKPKQEKGEKNNSASRSEPKKEKAPVQTSQQEDSSSSELKGLDFFQQDWR